MRLLLVSPRFPPSSAADSQRLRLLLPHLASAGCKAEVLAKFGGDTRIAMKGSKKYSGTLTVKLSVVPDGASRQRLLCKVTDDALVLTDKEGKPLS